MNDRRDLPPEPRYGWVMVGLAPLYLGFAIGSLGAIAVFLKPLIAEFGWLRGETALAYLAGNVGVGLGGILMGHLADRYNTRSIVLLGAVVFALGFFAMARQNTLWEFYLYSTLAAAVGSGSFFAPLLANVGGWFNRNKGLAIGIATAGQALGQGIVPYAAGLLIAWLGWRGAYNALGLFALGGLLPLALLIRNPPAHLGGEAQDGSLQAAPEVFAVPPLRAVSLLSLAAIFCCITMATPIVHVVPLASDQGLSAENSARVLLYLMVAGFFGRIFFGRLSDYIGGLASYLIASCWQTAVVFWFTQLSTPTGFYLLAVLFGFGFAGVMTCLVVCAQAFAPAARSGISTATVALFGFLGMGIGGFQAGYFFDLTGNYIQSFANATFAGLINYTILFSLLLYQRRGRVLLAASTPPVEAAAGD